MCSRAGACAALFGMNLVSGWESVDGLFWKVSSCSVSLGLLMYFGLHATHALRLGGHSSMSSYKLERDALHELLTYNLDDIGDIVLALAEAQKRCAALPAAQPPRSSQCRNMRAFEEDACTPASLGIVWQCSECLC